MDINQLMPLLSGFLNKGNQPQQNTTNQTIFNIYPDTTFDGKKINNQTIDTFQNQPKNNIFSSLIPTLLNGGNFDISSIANMFGKTENNLISSLFTPKNDKKTNPQKICEFVKVDDYELN